MKTLYVYSDLNCSCTRKNTFEIQKGFQNLGYTFDVVFCTDINEKHFQEYDVITFQRLGGNGVRLTQNYFDQVDKLIQEFKGKTLTCYTIDDLLPDEFVIKFIKVVDLVLVPNQVYEKYYGEHNTNFDYFKTFVDVERLREIQPYDKLPKDKFKMVWGSTALVGKEFMKKLVPSIVEEFPDDLLIAIGAQGQHFLKYCPKDTQNFLHFPILQFSSYIKVMKCGDVVLNPISVDPPLFFRGLPKEDFINCKSEIKYLNAAVSRLPFVSSKSVSYSRAIKNNVNGFLLDNDVNIWVDTLKKIKNDKNLSKTIVDNAEKDVIQNYNLEVTAQHIYEVYQKHFKEIVG